MGITLLYLCAQFWRQVGEAVKLNERSSTLTIVKAGEFGGTALANGDLGTAPSRRTCGRDIVHGFLC